MVSTNKVKGGHGIYKYNIELGRWSKLPGGAKRIAVTIDATPWIIDDKHRIYKWSDTWYRWVNMKMKGKEIAVGPEGSALIVDMTNSVQKYGIDEWHIVSTAGKAPAGNVR